ncbi:MAG: hypothetical protein GY858_05475 [Candidatus Omnitrophica bacterium]|nr:hypothetical protein [Candidatus Omnitrophota bacterium]
MHEIEQYISGHLCNFHYFRKLNFCFMESPTLQSPTQSQAVGQFLAPEWSQQNAVPIPAIPVESIQSDSGLRTKNFLHILPQVHPVPMLPTPISEGPLVKKEVKGAAKRKISLPKKRPQISSSSSGPDSSDSSILSPEADATSKAREKQYVCCFPIYVHTYPMLSYVFF